MRILIAEDDPISRRILQATLLKWGYEVEIACDGREAWEALQRDDSPRMAVLDWMMPEMDGLQICQALRERQGGPYVYTILLTAKSQRDDLLAGLTAGADDYVVKPFDPNELKVRIRAGKRILDLQAQLLAAKEACRLQAIRDPLTGLPNRLLFGEQLSDRLAQAKRQEECIAVMFLDLDRFKQINDSLGHNVGDLLLKIVADRLSGCLRQGDVVARMGGDEFTFVLTLDKGQEEIALIADRILASLAETFYVGDRQIQMSGSMGISIYPTHGTDAETLVMSADAAMYRAKELGRNGHQVFTENLGQEALKHVSLEADLRKALEMNQFVLHYQMLVDIATGAVPGVEALIRWRHPELGLLQPSQFIPFAEETGLIEPITEWVLHTACRQNRHWQELGLFKMGVAVNISPRVLHRVDLAAMVESALGKSDLNPRYLSLEVTETAIMRNPERAAKVLDEIRQMGVLVSVDDFGTGASSLSCLQRLPLGALKIDSSLVKDVDVNPNNATVARAMIAMAHSMDLLIVAEGVETLDQLMCLKALECNQIQGYFISRPVPAEELVYLLAEGSPALPNWVALAA